MDREARLEAFVPTADLTQARHFYVEVLGLELVADTPFATVVRSRDTAVRITPVQDLTPQPFTVLGWVVGDIRVELARLAERGVQATRYDGMAQDDDGVWKSPGGDLIAWFHDPDGNTLSLHQIAG